MKSLYWLYYTFETQKHNIDPFDVFDAACYTICHFRGHWFHIET